MGSVRRFAAINSKIRALEGQMLIEEDYKAILAASSIDEVIKYLKENTQYSKTLEAVSDDAGVETVEILLKKELLHKHEKLLHFFIDEYKAFFKTLYMRYEIEDLKLYLRAITRGEDISKFKDMIITSGMYSTLDYQLLSSAKSLEELIGHLKGTKYHKVLSYYLDESPSRRMFYMEMNLDRIYFKALHDQGDKFAGVDAKILKTLLGQNIDLLNLQWIFRGRKYYGLSPEEIVNYTLEGGYVFKYRKLKAISYLENLEDVIESIKASPYGFLFSEAEQSEIFFELEMEKFLYRNLNALRKTNHMNIVEPLVYLHRQEFEIRDLFTIMETKRYGISGEEAKHFLVRKIQ